MTRADQVARWARDAVQQAKAGTPAALPGAALHVLVTVAPHELGTWLLVEMRSRFTSVELGVVVRDEVGEQRIRLLAEQLADRTALVGMQTYGLHPDGPAEAPPAPTAKGGG